MTMTTRSQRFDMRARMISCLLAVCGQGLYPSQPASAASLAVAPEAKYEGSHGLSVTPSGCPGTAELNLGPGNVSGSHAACNRITADTVVIDGTTDFNAGVGFSVPGNATFAVNQGVQFQVLVDNATSQFAWVQDNSPNAEATYNALFYINPNSIALAANDELDVFAGYSDDGKMEFRVTLLSTGLEVAARSGESWVESAPLAIASDAWQFIEVAFIAGNGYGSAKLTLDGGSNTSVSGLTNATALIESVRLGAVDGVLALGSYGSFYLDSFISWR